MEAAFAGAADWPQETGNAKNRPAAAADWPKETQKTKEGGRQALDLRGSCDDGPAKRVRRSFPSFASFHSFRPLASAVVESICGEPPVLPYLGRFLGGGRRPQRIGRKKRRRRKKGGGRHSTWVCAATTAWRIGRVCGLFLSPPFVSFGHSLARLLAAFAAPLGFRFLGRTRGLGKRS
jgi:hypothetical protein